MNRLGKRRMNTESCNRERYIISALTNYQQPATNNYSLTIQFNSIQFNPIQLTSTVVGAETAEEVSCLSRTRASSLARLDSTRLAAPLLDSCRSEWWLRRGGDLAYREHGPSSSRLSFSVQISLEKFWQFVFVCAVSHIHLSQPDLLQKAKKIVRGFYKILGERKAREEKADEKHHQSYFYFITIIALISFNSQSTGGAVGSSINADSIQFVREPKTFLLFCSSASFLVIFHSLTNKSWCTWHERPDGWMIESGRHKITLFLQVATNLPSWKQHIAKS